MSGVPLEELIGPWNAAAYINGRVHDLVVNDCLPPGVALSWVCEGLADSNVLLLAAPGQIWQRRAAADPQAVPAERLQICQRLASPPRIVTEDEHGARAEQPIHVLRDYRLDNWWWQE